jgi:hypothetical protein
MSKQRVGFLHAVCTGLALTALCAAALVILSGCALNRKVIDVPSVTPTVVYQLGNAYGIAQGAAIAYTELPLCPPDQTFTSTVWCSDPRVIQQVAGYDAEFVRQYGKLQLWASDPSTLDGLSLLEAYAAASSALTGMQAILTQYREVTNNHG